MENLIKTNTSFSVIAKRTLTVIAFLAVLPSFAQEVIWASKVISATSQVGTGHHKYASIKALGKPDATPDSTGNGWQPIGSGKEETIVVGFDKAIHAKQILIVEGMHIGYIKRVYAISTDGMEYEVAQLKPRPGTKNINLISVNMGDFDINIAAVKVVMFPIRNVSSTIDAIGITESTHAFTLTKTHEMIAAQ